MCSKNRRVDIYIRKKININNKMEKNYERCVVYFRLCMNEPTAPPLCPKNRCIRECESGCLTAWLTRL